MSAMAEVIPLEPRERVVHVRKGQRVLIDIGLLNGVQLSLEHMRSGAVVLRNERTGVLLRQWSPKEAKSAS